MCFKRHKLLQFVPFMTTYYRWGICWIFWTLKVLLVIADEKGPHYCQTMWALRNKLDNFIMRFRSYYRCTLGFRSAWCCRSSLRCLLHSKR